MKINCLINDLTIKLACEIVEQNMNDQEFIKILRASYKEFTYVPDEKSFNKLIDGIQSFQGEILVKSYRTKNPFSKVIGYSANGVIYCNSRKKLDLRSRVENLTHESFHYFGFSHNKDNKASGDSLSSVPYLGAKIFVQMMDKRIGVVK
jgi:hypothetical protein